MSIKSFCIKGFVVNNKLFNSVCPAYPQFLLKNELVIVASADILEFKPVVFSHDLLDFIDKLCSTVQVSCALNRPNNSEYENGFDDFSRSSTSLVKHLLS